MFYVLLIVHPGMIFVNNQIDAQISFMFISILYMFRAAMCPSSGELLYQCDTWFISPSSMQEHMLLHTRRSSTKSDIYSCIPDGHLHSDICSCIPDGHLQKVTYAPAYQTVIYTVTYAPAYQTVIYTE